MAKKTKKETKKETKQEVKQEIKQETKKETKQEVKKETKQETKQEVKKETKQETKQEVKKEIKKDHFDTVIEDYIKQYELFQRKINIHGAIKSFSNIYSVIEKHPEKLPITINLFKRKKFLLDERVAWKGIDTFFEKKKSMKISIFYQVIRQSIYQTKSKISFDLVKDIIPTELLNKYIAVLKRK